MLEPAYYNEMHGKGGHYENNGFTLLCNALPSSCFFSIDNVCGFFCELTVHTILKHTNGVDQLKHLIRRKGKLLISFFRLYTEVANYYSLHPKL